MAKAKKSESVSEVSGRALVDIPALGAKCGEYLTLPAEQAAAYADAGEFDPAARAEDSATA